MKFYFLFLALFITSTTTAQQNLVLNGSFENYSACPSGIGQISNATGWMSFRQSTDYFSECATDQDAMVPGNFEGYQHPFDGIAYTGVVTWRIIFPEVHEFLASALAQPLQIGSVYLISFRTCLAIGVGSTCLATNHIGAKFSNTYYSELTPMSVDNNPHIDHPFFITDTVGWTTVSGLYVADSNYKYLVIGNFFNGDLTDTINITNYINPTLAYYYIDSVGVFEETADGVNLIKKIAPQLFGVPANDFCIVSMGTYQIDKVSVINLLGQEIDCSMKMESDRIIIETSEIASGNYFVKLQGNERTWTLPLTVQH